MNCQCVPLADMQASLIADGLPAPAVGILADLAHLVQRGHMVRCPDHPYNWRLTPAGLIAMLETWAEMA